MRNGELRHVKEVKEMRILRKANTTVMIPILFVMYNHIIISRTNEKPMKISIAISDNRDIMRITRL